MTDTDSENSDTSGTASVNKADGEPAMTQADIREAGPETASAGSEIPIPHPPSQIFRTILADPPWSLQQKGSYGASRHYPLMELDEIKALRVDRLAADNSHCWLWVTNASIHAGKEVLEAWGFTYRSILTWVKPRYGLGQYLRTATEHILLGTKGRAPIQFRSQPSWFFAPRQEHSHKPEEVFAIVERCSPGPYLELFARRKRPGWAAWGNEINCDVTP